jgi:putative lipoic acid-binding regulatory protein
MASEAGGAALEHRSRRHHVVRMTQDTCMTQDTGTQGFTFPGMFDITAFGSADAGLEALLPELVGACGVSVLQGSVRARPSSAGRYVAVSLSFLCPDRSTHEAVYNDVRAHPSVKWTL